MPSNPKHGLSYTTEYKAWQTMRLRCTVPTNKAYPDYGGRGITVCQRWMDSVEAFVADMGLKPTPKHELDRIDNSKGYSPENCRWVTRTDNCRNRRSNVWVEYQGRQMVLAEAIALSGADNMTVRKRLQLGWPLEKALSTPARAKAKNGEGVPYQRKGRPVNKYGFPGIKFDHQRNRYQGYKRVDGKVLYTKRFPTAEEAYAAYLMLGTAAAPEGAAAPTPP